MGNAIMIINTSTMSAQQGRVRRPKKTQSEAAARFVRENHGIAQYKPENDCQRDTGVTRIFEEEAGSGNLSIKPKPANAALNRAFVRMRAGRKD